MPRFFVDSFGPEADFVILTGEQAAHAKVLRLKPGEAAVLCDGQGTDYQAEVTELDSSSVTLRILSRGPSESEPKVDCTVYMGFAKGDKLEHVIQKATELGANRICAFPSSRCVAKFDRKGLENRCFCGGAVRARANPHGICGGFLCPGAGIGGPGGSGAVLL